MSSAEPPIETTTADLALVRLLRLASPMLPVGAFSYSQGFETAAELGWVTNEASAAQWIDDVLSFNFARFEAPIWSRLYRAWYAEDHAAAERWNAVFLAGRESAELRAETMQMGYSLRTLFVTGEEFNSSELRSLGAIEGPAFPTVFTFACARWRIREDRGLLGYCWAWLENQAGAAMKIVPLGQSAGQRILVTLGAKLPELVETALGIEDDQLSNCAPGFAIASARHEAQYSRLFRS